MEIKSYDKEIFYVAILAIAIAALLEFRVPGVVPANLPPQRSL